MNKALSFDDILLRPSYCQFDSRKDVDTSVTIGNLRLRVPILSSNMDSITGSVMARKMAQLGGLGILHRFCTISDNVKMFEEALYGTYPTPAIPNVDDLCHIGVSVGVNEGTERSLALYKAGARIFCVDVAHGHSKLCGDMVKELRKQHGTWDGMTIIAGNVCTLQGANYLAECGADIIKVGIGPGSVCSTRIKTGFGVPQVTAIQDCSRCSKPIIADGGIRTPSDVVKSLALGSKMVMLGGMLAGTNESNGHKHQTNEGLMCSYRGMASREAFEDFFGAMPDWKTAEGVAVEVKCKGPVEDVIKDIVGGLRSGLTYCGAANLDELRAKAEFVQITEAGRHESTAHHRP